MSQVACVSCGALVDSSKADVTGRGFRCNSCSMKASLAADGGRNDVADHLTAEERIQRAKAAGTEMVVGLGIAALGALLLLGFNGTVGIIVTCAGFGTTSHGYLTRREMTGVRTS